MARQPLMAIPVEAPVKQAAFDLVDTLAAALIEADETLHDGDILAISSKYVAISEGRVVAFDDVQVTAAAEELARRYRMNEKMAQLVLDEADHIFGGIHGFLLTHKDGIVSANAGIDRSNIPGGHAVLFPAAPYESAAHIRAMIRQRLGIDVGIILTDSWLMPGRLGTSGVALAAAGFEPLQDERDQLDLFGNPMRVTVVGVADSLSVVAQAVMGERDEATPFAILRNTGVELSDNVLSVKDVAIDWQLCLYIQSLTDGLLTQELVQTEFNDYLPEVVL